MEKIVSVDFLKEYWQPWDHLPLIMKSYVTDEGVRQGLPDGLAAHKWEAIKLYLQLLPRNPTICLKEIITNTHALWSFTEPNNIFYCHSTLALALLAMALVRWSKADWKRKWVLFLPGALNALSIVISTVTNEERYYLPTFLLFVPLALSILEPTLQRSDPHDPV
ncbi:MAG: hypothetical protein LBJ11_07390 [Oscillospiraceae bacterium]|jgi:hypothetical protein|nr:hypothetical protein [Oscillospiraceae bacterium]